VVSGLREIAAPFVVAAPAGVRVRTRLRVPPEDEAVLRAAGTHLGSLAGRDLAARCACAVRGARCAVRGRAARREGPGGVAADGNVIGTPATIALSWPGCPPP
jgi:hypothetical protein